MMNRTISNMRTYAYELYKIQWLQRISTERHLDALRNYVEEEIPEKFEMYENFEEYLEERGFDGEIYSCYEEFIDNEYKDEDYMKELFDNEKIFNYYKSIDLEFGENEDEQE